MTETRITSLDVTRLAGVSQSAVSRVFTLDASTQRDREAGFLEGLNLAKRDLFAHEAGNFDFEQAKAAARAMFDVPADRRPDALFVANDHMAFVAIDVIRHELGLSIPDEVSVVGFDDVPSPSIVSLIATFLHVA